MLEGPTDTRRLEEAEKPRAGWRWSGAGGTGGEGAAWGGKPPLGEVGPFRRAESGVVPGMPTPRCPLKPQLGQSVAGSLFWPR